MQTKSLRKKKLALAAVSALWLGSFTGAAEAASYSAEYTTGITTDAAADAKAYGGAFSISNNIYTYNIGNAARIKIANRPVASSVTIGQGKGAIINVGGGSGTLYTWSESDNSGNSSANGAAVKANGAFIVNGNIWITARSNSCFASGFALDREPGTGSGAAALVNGKLTIRDPEVMDDLMPDSFATPWGVNAKELHGGLGPDGHVGGADHYTGARWQPTGVSVDMHNAWITLNGDVDIAIRGTALKTDPWYKGADVYNSAVINANNGAVKLMTPMSTTEAYYAAASYGGTININMADPANYVPGGNQVNILGNILVMNGDQSPFYQSGRINMALTRPDSAWIGVVDNCGRSQTGEFNLWLRNGAGWGHWPTSKVNGLDATNMPSPSVEKYGVYTPYSFVNFLLGDTNMDNCGYILTQDPAKIYIKHYTGITKVLYAHNGSGSSAADYPAGDIIIENAYPTAGLILMTDQAGIDINNPTAVRNTLNALAGKLWYYGAKTGNNNLIGIADIAEGLTASSAHRRFGAINFSQSDGHGSIASEIYSLDPAASAEAPTEENEVLYGQSANKEQTVSLNEDILRAAFADAGDIEYGSYETTVMRGARAAMNSAVMAWRAENNDLMKRMGDLRLSPNETGAWGRVYRGRNSADKDGAKHYVNYTTVQLGYDRQVGKNWKVGTAFSYMDGKSGYDLGGNGENKEYNIGFYGTYTDKSGQFVDLIAKFGHLTNDYTVYNELGNKVDGNYGTNGFSLSAEYGKRFKQKNGFYLEPAAELNYAHLNGAGYTANSNFSDGLGGSKSMRVNQSGFNSLIGRIGLGFGYETKKSTIFAKVSLNHEFGGSLTNSFSAENLKSVDQKFRDTWLALQLGGTAKLSDRCNFYGTVEKTFGGDVKTDYRIDAGFRFEF